MPLVIGRRRGGRAGRRCRIMCLRVSEMVHLLSLEQPVRHATDRALRLELSLIAVSLQTLCEIQILYF